MAKGLSVVKPAIRNYNVDDEEFVDTAAAVFSDVVNFIYKLRQRYSIEQLVQMRKTAANAGFAAILDVAIDTNISRIAPVMTGQERHNELYR